MFRDLLFIKQHTSDDNTRILADQSQGDNQNQNTPASTSSNIQHHPLVNATGQSVSTSYGSFHVPNNSGANEESLRNNTFLTLKQFKELVGGAKWAMQCSGTSKRTTWCETSWRRACSVVFRAAQSLLIMYTIRCEDFKT